MTDTSTHCGFPSSTCPHADESAEIAVRKVFAILGVDINIPKDVEEFRQDLRFGSKLRKASDKGFLAFIMAVGGAIATALFVGIQFKLTGGN